MNDILNFTDGSCGKLYNVKVLHFRRNCCAVGYAYSDSADREPHIHIIGRLDEENTIDAVRKLYEYPPCALKYLIFESPHWLLTKLIEETPFLMRELKKTLSSLLLSGKLKERIHYPFSFLILENDNLVFFRDIFVASLVLLAERKKGPVELRYCDRCSRTFR